jgi:hypothetical protein
MDTEIGDISRVSIFYYDDEELMTDALYSPVKINSTSNINAVHNLSIGWVNTFVIQSYLYKMVPKNYNNNKT